MPAIMVLNIPEFAPIVHTAREAGMTVRELGDYVEVSSSEQEVVLERRHTDVRPAVWFAALTGGLIGEFVQFDHDELRIVNPLS
ncbi:hypothetical protein [Amycolatopsis sp. H20-H5]|uniref:hypothetical protein n=1 Tax=Amycolatopsis sp. H20-H5 TaxID=3046309 RepID=UPI002DB5DD1E|nr:hypothetical protein [Amycolatopsis sp. H20-H5]MEC3982039.1 hypothetical protein [Amycolatopsis sp. H20-H5]